MTAASLSTAQYLLSLPERVFRSAAAIAGGVLQEISGVTIPAAVRRTNTYRMMVGLGLRFLVEQVGEVEGVYPAEGQLTNDFILRRTAGHGIELAGILAFHASPVWILAALADISGAGRQIVNEISQALQEEGLLERGKRFETIDQMLDGLEQSAASAATVINSPPIDVAGLRAEWARFQANASKIPPRRLPSPEMLRHFWEEMKNEAANQNRSVFELSSLLALSSIAQVPNNLHRLARAASRAAWSTGQSFAGPLFDHYRDTLKQIHQTGYLAYWSQEFRPYLRAAAAQFSPRHPSLTERLLRRTQAAE
jgi:hypothetical protein